MKIEVSVDDILDNTSEYEKQTLYNELKGEYGEDVEDLVDDAFDSTKRTIFRNLMDEGYGDHLLNNDEPLSLEDKRFMMDKEDEDMLDYLIEKYKYFG